MKKILITLILCCNVYFSNAQLSETPNTSINLGKEEVPVKIIDLKVNGFIVLTGELSGMTYPINYYKVDTNLNLQWSIKSKGKTNPMYLDGIVASEFTDMIYHYNLPRNTKASGLKIVNGPSQTIELLRLNNNGAVDSFEIQAPEDFSTLHLNSVFSNSEILVLISNNEDINAYIPKKSIKNGAKPCIDMLVIPHDSKKFKHIKISWDEKVEKNALEFLGNDEEAFYFLIKQKTEKFDQINQTIYKYDYDGKLLEIKTFEAAQSNTIIPYNNLRNFNGQNFGSMDVYMTYTQNGSSTFYSNTALGAMKLDLRNNRLYSYGFESSKFKGKKNIFLTDGAKFPTHLFLKVYDFNTRALLNELEWEIENEEMKEVIRKNNIVFNFTDLNSLGNNNYALTLMNFETAFVYNINFNSNHVSPHTLSEKNINIHPKTGLFYQQIFAFRKELLSSRASNFINSNQGKSQKDVLLFGLASEKSSIFLKFESKKKKMELFLFRR